MKTINLILSASLIAIGFASCSKEKKQNPVIIEEIPVTLLTINSNSGSQPLKVSGTLTTDDEVNLSFTTGGIVTKIVVNEGDAVVKGQLLATLNSTEAKAKEQQDALKKELANRTFERTANLYSENATSKEQYQNDKTMLDIAIQEWETSKFNLQHTEIRAIKNGFIVNKFIEAGTQVGPGTPVLSMFGGQPDAWIVKVQINDDEWMAVNEGDFAEVMINNDNIKAKGKVIRKSQSTIKGSGSYMADILLDKNVSLKLAQGMFAHAFIYPSSKSNLNHTTVSIPYDALLDADGKTGYVFIPGKDNKAKKVKVVIDEMRNEKVVLSSGLEGVSEIILSGSAYLKENSLYKVIKTNSLTQ